MRNHLPNLYAEERKKLKEELSSTDWIALTTDMWISRNNAAFVNISVHSIYQGKLTTKILDCSQFSGCHTGSNIAARLPQVLEYIVREKVVAVTTDNAANAKKAVKEASFPQIGCFAHTINLSSVDVLERANLPELEEVRARILF